jgi:acyl-CoA reductase-like NAD-dependent aldehyde dehydrogenase/nicotinamidase-related amidase
MKPALLLVDLQNDYLAATGLQPTGDILISRAAVLLGTCRKRQIPVIHIWTTIHRHNDQRLPHWKEKNHWQCVAGTAGHKTPELLRPLKGETIIHKTGFNAFANPELDAALRKINCDAVILAGLHLHACVRSTATESLERGLQVFIAEDAVASNDPIHAAATRHWLAKRYVRFDSISTIFSRLKGKTKPILIHHSPHETDRILFEVPIADADEIKTATAAAQNSWIKWRQTKLSSRLKIFEKVAARLDTAAPKLARQMAIEVGKPVLHGLEEVRRASTNVRDVIRRAAAFEFQKHEAAGVIRHEPLGVVGLISPWNNPVAIPIGKIAPALIYGNVVVWKPAPAATKISAVILKLLRECGVPRGTIQLLNGDHKTAQQIAGNENINAITLTGSAQAGFAVQEICARRIVPLQAELSGNNAAIVWGDADLQTAATLIAWGAFGFAGQRCTANRRVIVPKKLLENFLRELKIAAEKLVWGDPLERTTDVGPVIHAGKREEHLALIQAAQNSGAARRVEFLFEKRAEESWVKAGAYAQPVIVCCDEPNHPLVQEETMSPLLVVQRAENFEHALKLCNGVRHGLVAALFSNSREFQKKFLAEAQAGMLKFNSSTAGADISLPFGGWKTSGIGPPEHGEGDPLFYTKTQTIYE